MKIPMWLLALALLSGVPAAHAAEGDGLDRSGGPYVPTPQAVVEAMLDLARVGPDDFVIDLGSGDGRIVLTAAQRHGARGLGVDIDPERVDEANAAARRMGLADRVRFIRQDVRKTDIRRATVLTLYLLPGMMNELKPKLLSELRPGTRVVSHDFGFDLWRPDRTVTVETREKYDLVGSWSSEVLLWIVPPRPRGAWRPGPAAAQDGRTRSGMPPAIRGAAARGGVTLAALRGASRAP